MLITALVLLVVWFIIDYFLGRGGVDPRARRIFWIVGAVLLLVLLLEGLGATNVLGRSRL